MTTMMNPLTQLLKGTSAYYLLIFIVPVIIGLYGRYRCNHIKDHKDVLEWELFKGSSKTFNLDGWSVSHFLLFMIMGYFFPQTLLLSMLLGASWELFETYVGKYKPAMIQGMGFCGSPTSHKGKVWWYGKWSDLIMNFLGFIVGRYLTTGRPR